VSGVLALLHQDSDTKQRLLDAAEALPQLSEPTFRSAQES